MTMTTELEALLAEVNAQRQKIEESRSGFGARAKFWKPEAGENIIRVMPKWADDIGPKFWREVYQHWNVSEDQKGPILCPKQTPDMNGECPICDLVDALKSNKADVEAQRLVKEIRAKKTYLLNVVDQKDPVYTAQDVAEFKQARGEDEVPFAVGDPKVQIYAAPTTVFENILGLLATNKSDITNLRTGRDIRINKKPNKVDRRKTRYEVFPSLDATDTGYGETLELPNLSAVGFTLEPAEMHKLLAEGAAAPFVAALPGGSSGNALPAPADGVLPPEDETSAAPVAQDDLEAQLRKGLQGG